ncbi:MAG: 50S ribosomal protein L25/general stress protein Ctc [Alsobacter sp.]
MSTNVKQLKAAARQQGGKGAARSVRRDGRIPAVIYGGGEPPVSISLDGKEATQLIFAGHFLTTQFEIDVDGAKTRVIPRDYQLDPVKDTPLHVDFLRLREGQLLRVEVPVHFVNHETSPGLKRGGTLNVVLHSVELLVPANDIPEAITIDLAGSDIGQSIHISAVKLPANVRPVDASDFTVATLVAPSGLKEEPAAAAAEAAPAAAAAPAKK